MIRQWILLGSVAALIGCNRAPAPTTGQAPVQPQQQRDPESPGSTGSESIVSNDVIETEVLAEEIMVGSDDVQELERRFARGELAEHHFSLFRICLPGELQFSCVAYLDPVESFLADKLKSEIGDEQLRAARQLWRNHSRRQAANVLELCAESSSANPEFLRFKQEVAGDCRPARILEEMSRGDYAWGAWLATVKPDSTLSPALVAALDTKPEFRSETIVALGKTPDLQARDALIKVLRGKDYQEAGFAAGALSEFGDETIETELLAVLSDSQGWFRAKICWTLGQIGTSRSLPNLEPIAASTEYTGAIGVRRVAQEAIDKIQIRLP